MNSGPEWMHGDVREAEESAALSRLETELTGALRPMELPAGLGDRIVAAATAEPRRARVLRFRSRGWIAAGAVAASVLLGSFVTQEIHERRERERQQITEQQFETAMRVTYRALDQTRGQLARAGFRLSK